MRVLMLGWEFPPYISGGLGTACYGLTKGLDEVGVEVVFVLPTSVPVDGTTHVQVRTPQSVQPTTPGQRATSAGAPGGAPVVSPAPQPRPMQHVEFRTVPATLQAYGTPAPHRPAMTSPPPPRVEPPLTAAPPGAGSPTTGQRDASPPPAEPRTTGPAETSGHEPVAGFIGAAGAGTHYAGDLMEQVRRYAGLATQVACKEQFDVVHAHDWMTYPAGLAVAGVTGKPLVVHVHSTEFDRSGENVDQRIYDIERTGMHGAEQVICVSHLTRSVVLQRYGVPADKVAVVYNAVDLTNGVAEQAFKPIARNEKIVLFLGRITMQKGPEYFLAAAKKVLEKFPDVRFVMAGSGDMIRSAIEMAASLGIGGKVAFTGFLRGQDVDRVFQMADLYVMPSVSEPFGIAPLEALSHNVPVIISRQSGVSEVLEHALKVDFWDTTEMANKILAVLRHPPLQRVLREHGQIELRKLSWKDSATRCRELYEKAVSSAPR